MSGHPVSALAWLATVSWTCMVCGRWRPDEAISVAHRHIDTRTLGALRFNVRYCNDDPACAGYALAAGPWRGAPDRPARLEFRGLTR